MSRPRGAPRIRSVLLVTNLVVLVLPLCGLVGMRFYENELIRRTESELYAQGAFIRETYRAAVIDALNVGAAGAVESSARIADFGAPADPRWLVPEHPEDELRPIAPTLSRRAGRILPPAPLPEAGPAIDAISLAAGEFVMPILLRAKNVTLAGIRVVDFNGTEVANTRGDPPGLTLRSWDEVPRALRGEVVSQLRERISDEPRPALASRSRGTRVRVFVAMPIMEGERVLGAVVLSRTPLSLGKGLYNNREALILAGLLLVAVVLLLSRFTSRTIAGPMDRLVAQTKRIAEGEAEGRVPLERPGTHEAHQVSVAMARMAVELGEREDYIRAFATSVSHELKTPLTSMRGSIELLQDHWATMTDEERRRFLGVLESERDRLERLVRRVLELARADVSRPGSESCDASAVVGELVAREAAHGRTLRFDAAPQSANVTIAAELLDTVLAALVTNAWQHGGDDVALAMECLDECVQIAISDRGPGISDANAERVFESFFTTDREGGGTGVGLAIVRALCDSHGGSVALERSGGRTFFVIRLPRAPQDS